MYALALTEVSIMSRRDKIVERLQAGEESAANLARILDCPEASVRRDIQALRRAGYNVSFADAGEQLYRMEA